MSKLFNLRVLSLFALMSAFLPACVPAGAAAQDYVFSVRNNGTPVTGLATAMTSSETAYNATSETSVSSGLPPIHEFGSTGRYVVHYDAAANGPLILIIDAGSGVADPNERYFEVHLVADPALIASGAPLVGALHADTQWKDIHAYTAGNTAYNPLTHQESVFDVVSGIVSGTAQLGFNINIASGVTTARVRTN